MKRTREGEFSYKNNELHGLLESYYENGKPHTKVMYVNNDRNGLYLEWHSNGQLRAECEYVNGKKDGSYRKWYANGELRSKGICYPQKFEQNECNRKLKCHQSEFELPLTMESEELESEESEELKSEEEE